MSKVLLAAALLMTGACAPRTEEPQQEAAPPAEQAAPMVDTARADTTMARDTTPPGATQPN
jgi:hypothetical protein